jgi:hypothetical protein
LTHERIDFIGQLILRGIVTVPLEPGCVHSECISLDLGLAVLAARTNKIRRGAARRALRVGHGHLRARLHRPSACRRRRPVLSNT